MSLVGAVLAAGRSDRMGSPKALLDFRGRPFVAAILAALEALDLKVRVVVLGPDAARIRPAIAVHDCLIVETSEPDAGPIGSLRAALAAVRPIRPSGLLAWPVDQPHVRIATVERLIEEHARSRAPVVLPAFARRRGHPVIFDAAVFDELASSSAATTQGARAVVRAHAAALAEVAVDDPGVLDDIDTPEDYERLIRAINREAY
jgi:CTP:molybdopterin cytidylyltransferase MocA